MTRQKPGEHVGGSGRESRPPAMTLAGQLAEPTRPRH
jgi:hypothetical protein